LISDLVLAVGSLVLAGWVGVYVMRRAAADYGLDAFEEYELTKAARWLRGEPLYTDPNDEPFPTAYPPLHYWLLALCLKWGGMSFVVGRIPSLAATAATIAVGAAAVRRGSGTWLGPWLFAALFLSMHVLTGKWFELCKNDSLLVALLAVAMAAGEHRTWSEVVASSSALWLASLTKQNAPLFVLPLLAAHVLNGRWRWGVAWAGGMTVFIGLSYAALAAASHGAFWHWVFGWPAAHGVSPVAGLARVWTAVWRHGWGILPAAIVALVLRPRDRWTWVLLVSLAVAWMGMSKRGGIPNHLYPAALAAAVVLSRDLAWLWHWAAARRTPVLWKSLAALGLVTITWPGMPRRRDFRWIERRQAEAVAWRDAVRKLPGRVLVAHHALLAAQAGAQVCFSDQIWQFPGLVLPQTARRALSEGEFDWLVLGPDPTDSRVPGWADLVTRRYGFAGALDAPFISGVLPARLYFLKR
jgi:hypothetical protein